MIAMVWYGMVQPVRGRGSGGEEMSLLTQNQSIKARIDRKLLKRTGQFVSALGTIAPGTP